MPNTNPISTDGQPPADQVTDQSADQVTDQPTDQVTDQPADQVTDQPANDEDHRSQTGKNADPNQEAAKYRRQLRAVETERDTLAAHLEANRRAQAEAAAAEVLQRPNILWRLGVDTKQLLDPNGVIDPNLVRQQAKALADEYGLTPGRPHVGLRIDPPAPMPIISRHNEDFENSFKFQ